MKSHVFKVIVGAFCIGWLVKNVLAPVVGLTLFYGSYLELSSQCANAMDNGWFIQQSESEDLKKSADINLLICHDYDKTRKLMLTLGVSEDLLAYIGLKGLELNQHSVEELVKQHRFQSR